MSRMSIDDIIQLPRPLTSYPDAGSLAETIAVRASIEPFNVAATAIFMLAILHIFIAPKLATAAHRLQSDTPGGSGATRTTARVLHLLGEVELVFGLWALVLVGAMAVYAGGSAAGRYLVEGVSFTEALFVVVVMTVAATRPIVTLAESGVRALAALGRGTPGAWWMAILMVGPLLGSFITEPAAMTICALLLARQFYALRPGATLKYATLGLLFVNVSVGGTLTHFAAPPVLMVARPWGWDTAYMLTTFGWRAATGVAISTLLYYFYFRREFERLKQETLTRPADRLEIDPAVHRAPIPVWVTIVHMAFLVWTVVNSHNAVLFLLGFVLFLAFARATAVHQGRLEMRTPLLVGLFLAGLVIHGGLQGWWIAPVLSSLAEFPLFLGATFLTAFNDNALITYLATLAPDLGAELRIAVVQGAVLGGGLTVIANAPNPAGQALLSRYFDDAISPVGLFLGALAPTVVTGIVFRL